MVNIPLWFQSTCRWEWDFSSLGEWRPIKQSAINWKKRLSPRRGPLFGQKRRRCCESSVGREPAWVTTLEPVAMPVGQMLRYANPKNVSVSSGRPRRWIVHKWRWPPSADFSGKSWHISVQNEAARTVFTLSPVNDRHDRNVIAGNLLNDFKLNLIIFKWNNSDLFGVKCRFTQCSVLMTKFKDLTLFQLNLSVKIDFCFNCAPCRWVTWAPSSSAPRWSVTDRATVGTWISVQMTNQPTIELS